jgi:hypothetical protein
VRRAGVPQDVAAAFALQPGLGHPHPAPSNAASSPDGKADSVTARPVTHGRSNACHRESSHRGHGGGGMGARSAPVPRRRGCLKRRCVHVRSTSTAQLLCATMLAPNEATRLATSEAPALATSVATDATPSEAFRATSREAQNPLSL